MDAMLVVTNKQVQIRIEEDRSSEVTVKLMVSLLGPGQSHNKLPAFPIEEDFTPIFVMLDSEVGHIARFRGDVYSLCKKLGNIEAIPEFSIVLLKDDVLEFRLHATLSIKMALRFLLELCA